ncbi:TPA: hypothetical protein QCP51_005337 [Bacillus cereus]|nr:hypothetical protein [Bacillus cereus]HDR6957502.1 hypothetical protein [Bacillus cereus]
MLMILTILIVFTPHLVSAHVKWFTTVTKEKASITDIISPMFLIVTLISTSILILLPIILLKIKGWGWAQTIESKLQSYSLYCKNILIYGTAISLAIQIMTGSVLAPELIITSEVVIWIVWIIVLLLIIPNNVATKIGGWGILGLYTWITVGNGFSATIDYVFYVAIALALIIENKRLSIPILYIFTGFSLCWVSMEKIVYPSMAIDIIIKHNVPTFGFTPEDFTLLCAFIEFVLGYLLFVGIFNRTLAVIITGVFMSTVCIFGIKEIIGHFMIHIVLIIFIIEGANEYVMPIKICKRSINMVVFLIITFLYALFFMLTLYYIYV